MRKIADISWSQVLCGDFECRLMDHKATTYEAIVLVLIDESGDPGFKIVRGSTPYFVMAMVIFSDLKEAERASDCVARARERLRVKPEFKFTKSHDNVRDGFLESVCACDFSVRALIVDKTAVYSDHLRDDTEAFYSYFVRLLLSNDNGALKGAKIKIDGSGDREFKQELNRYLRRQISADRVVSVKFGDSCKDNLLQLADMCAGAVARARRKDDKRDTRWLDQLSAAGRIQDLWDFR